MGTTDRQPGDRQVTKPSGGADCPFVTRQIAGQTIIVPVRDRSADLDAIYTLNEVGSRIWELLEGPTSTQSLAGRISEEFDVSPEQAAQDVAEFLGELQAICLVRLTDGEGQG